MDTMVSVGIDIVDNQRIKKLMTDTFVKKILSNEEYNEYISILTEDRKVEFIAGRLAAKEAALKCLKKETLCSIKEIVVQVDETGAPYVIHNGYNISISISHEKLFSVAVALQL